MKFKFLIIIFSVLLIGVVVGYGQQNYQAIKPSHHHHPEVPRITAFEAMELYKQGKLILVLAQEPQVYANKRIIGSISLPEDDKYKLMNVKLPRNIIVAFYCD